MQDHLGNTNLFSLLQVCVKRVPINFSAGHLPGVRDLRIPRRKLTGSSCVAVQLTFENVQEVRRRVGLLFLNTWRPTHRSPVRLMSAHEAACHLWATLIQVCVCVCVCVYVYVYVRVCEYTHMHPYRRTKTAEKYAYMYKHAYIRTYILQRPQNHIHIYIYMYLYTCM